MSVPTVQQFKTRFPVFTAINDSVVLMVLQEADEAVGDTWPEDKRTIAQLYFTAHFLAMEGHRAGGKMADPRTGPLIEFEVGEVREKYADLTAGGQVEDHFKMTTFGQRFIQLRRQAFGGPIAV